MAFISKHHCIAMPSPAQAAHSLILASTSRYRKALLSRLTLPFDCISPLVDETPHANEAPLALAQRLALAKAQAVAALYPNAFVIGSDQVLDLNGQCLGKPGDHAGAVTQLRSLRGQTVLFHSTVAVIHAGRALSSVSTIHVRYKPFTDAQIEAYLRIDQPYDCAGSAKSEALGIALCESIQSDDPTALEGLPLTHTLRLLTELGYEVFEQLAARVAA